jgi:hypothetical protein
VEKILILEEAAERKPAGYDRVFSYIENPADVFSSDFLDPRGASEIYDRVFSELMPRLEELARAADFKYRDVDILWCFKKPLFECAYFIALRREGYRRLAAAHPDAAFELQKAPRGLPHGIGLADILDASPRPAPRPRGGAGPVRPPALWRSALARLSADPRLGSRAVAVYADYAKAEGLARPLGERGVFFSDSASPRVWRRAAADGLGYYAIAADGSGRQYADLAAAFLEKASRPLFATLDLAGSGAGRLLDQRLAGLFAGSLAPLLAAVDELHGFFGRAKALRTALLDEDIAPVKNAFCQAARGYGVRTFVECHGALGHASGFLPLTADTILVWGEAQREKLVRWSCPPDRIAITGSSRYERYRALDPAPLKARVARDFGLDPARPIVLVAFPPFKRHLRLLGHAELKVIRDTLEAVDRVEGLQFVVKIHPGDENCGWYAARYPAARCAGRVAVVEKYDPMLLARAADFLVVHNSTYALDGFAMEKPVVSVFDGPCRILEEMREFGVFHYAETVDEIERAVRRLAGAPNERRGRWEEARARCLHERGSPREAILGHLLNTQRQPMEVT